MPKKSPPPKPSLAPDSISVAFHQAVNAHKQGNLAAAEDGYKSVLAARPEEIEARYLLGALLVQSERDEEAIPHLEKYIRRHPSHGPALNALGSALAKTGQHENAISTLKRAVEATPGDVKVLMNLGRSAVVGGNPEEGVRAYKQALRLNPGLVEATVGQATCLAQLDEVEAAIAMLLRCIDDGAATSPVYERLLKYLIESTSFDDALKYALKARSLWPDNDAFVLAHATVLRHIHPRENARAVYEELIARDPDNPSYLNKFGDYLYDLGQWDEAEVYVRKSLAIEPKAVGTVNNLGRIRQHLGDLDGSIRLYNEAIDIMPDFADAHNNLGNVLLYTDQIDDAITAFDKAIALKPHSKDYIFNRSIALITKGDIHRHLGDHWTRFEKKKPVSTRQWPWPKWSGEPIEGRRIFLYGEQGIGDEVIHVRCISRVMDKAAHATLECAERLIGLFQRSFPGLEFCPYQNPIDENLRKSQFDYQSSTLDMNCWDFDTPQDIPSQPYLKADPVMTRTLRARYQDGDDKRPLIGISWSSGGNIQSHFKSVPLERWKPILSNTDVRFVNLQYGDWHKELKLLEERDGLSVLSDPAVNPLGDLDLFAAQIAAMDQVVTISNATAHLAGALGVPVWNMVPTGPGRLWYWFLEGSSCPWYSSMRLFRHAYNEGWDNVLDEVQRGLIETIPSLGSPTHLPY